MLPVNACGTIITFVCVYVCMIRCIEGDEYAIECAKLSAPRSEVFRNALMPRKVVSNLKRITLA
jgi:hypothetical protein